MNEILFLFFFRTTITKLYVAMTFPPFYFSQVKLTKMLMVI